MLPQWLKVREFAMIKAFSQIRKAEWIFSTQVIHIFLPLSSSIRWRGLLSKKQEFPSPGRGDLQWGFPQGVLAVFFWGKNWVPGFGEKLLERLSSYDQTEPASQNINQEFIDHERNPRSWEECSKYLKWDMQTSGMPLIQNIYNWWVEQGILDQKFKGREGKNCFWSWSFKHYHEDREGVENWWFEAKPIQGKRSLSFQREKFNFCSHHWFKRENDRLISVIF